MHPEDKFRLIQERAYEIYQQRIPNEGTSEEDWQKAEAEIEREEHVRSTHTGPARLKEREHWSKIVTHVGEDIENPA